MPAVITRALSTLSLLILVAPALADDSKPESDQPTKVSYHNDIEPILRRNCFGCHQGAKNLGSYRMTDFSSLVAGGETGEPAIVPRGPEASYLIDQITMVDGAAEMPKAPAKPLSEIEVETIRRWIEQGAENDSPADTGPKYTKDKPPVYTGAPALPSIDVSPVNDLVAVAGFHEVILLNSTNGELVGRLVGLSPRINSVRFSPDGKHLAVVGGTPAVSGEVQIWEVESQALKLSLPVTYDALSGASWSPDGSKLAFGAADNVLRAIDAATGEQVLYQGAHEDWVRDTVFTKDGTHLVSVARDMSCKLTEVETERFIDNITSITPGALSGGLSSVDRFPGRNEILVGGADGVPKIYRCFRETARKIGDDANLIRALPKLKGRIFSVAISPDGTRMAAAATLDGKSEVRIWEADFDGKLTDELKKILAKRVKDRKPEENKKVTDYRNSSIKELSQIQIEDASVYSIQFAKDNTLFVSGNDGRIRQFKADGSPLNQFAAINVSDNAGLAASSFDARSWAEWVAKQNAQRMQEVNEPGIQDDAIARLDVLPSAIRLNSPYGYAQLIVTAVAKDGDTVDVTRLSDISVPEFATVTRQGLIRPVHDGSASITVTYGGKTEKIEIVAANIDGDTHGAVDFIRDVNPVLSRLGCNQGTCHGAQKGKNGFKLSLRGYDPIFDVRALTDDLAARRINASAPEESLMLRKPLGLSPHQGGALMHDGDPNHVILRRWIADGSRLNMDSQRAIRIEVSPHNPIVQSNTARQQVRVVAHYPDGGSRDVTQEAFIESGNSEVAITTQGGLLQAVRRGEAPILARYEGNYAATTLTVMGDRGGYEETETETWTRIDELVKEKWKRVKVTPSGLCDDATFLRRVYLDLTGLPPSSTTVRDFLDDQSPTREKRAKVVDQLIGSEAFVDYWTNKWADLLQVNRKYLGVEGSTKFHDWIKTAVKENRRYDEFARQILTATGSNNQNAAASYFKILRTPEDTMENTTHLFLGIRFNCNKCHDHPFERWTQDQYYELSAFFAQVALKNDPASGNRKIGGTAVEGAKPLFEEVIDKKDGDVKHARTGDVVKPSFPYEVAFECGDNVPRRQQLAAWMTDADNPYFARSYVNRLWGYLFGVGLIEPIDDIRAGNPPTNPELLDHLTRSFVDSGFDTQQMLRLICNSRTYQLSVETNPLNEDDTLNYSRALPRRLPAEVIYDAVHYVTGAVSNIPGQPKGTRAAAITDAGVKLKDGFLQNLGRPARESACECERASDLQLGPVMALISGPTIGTAIADPQNELPKLVQDYGEDQALAEEIFLRALGRRPSESELAAFAQMGELIQQDHRQLVQRLQQAEADWKVRRAQLEQRREEKLAAIVKQIDDRTKEIKPERERLENERQDRIKVAQANVQKAKDAIGKQVEKWEQQRKTEDLIEWFPLAASKTSATNKAVLAPQSDRSIFVSGNSDKAVYTVEVKTQLQNITGFRLEALSDSRLPNNGPGLPKNNGNFVLTEFEILMAATAEPKKSTQLKIASGNADFLQGGFSAKATFDGQTRNQGGWAVAGATGIDHWITYKLDKPIKNEAGSILTFKLHQFHNAPDHRLGRFRISATTNTGEIPLDLPESLSAALATAKQNRSDEQQKLLHAHVAATDQQIRKANEALGVARRAVPPDSKLVQLENRKKQLEKPTPDDPRLVRLRSDAEQSTKQLQNIRLTAAEDLTWALINSPAFLFNH